MKGEEKIKGGEIMGEAVEDQYWLDKLYPRQGYLYIPCWWCEDEQKKKSKKRKEGGEVSGKSKKSKKHDKK